MCAWPSKGQGIGVISTVAHTLIRGLVPNDDHASEGFLYLAAKLDQRRLQIFP